MRRQELSGPVQCGGRFVEDRVKGLEDVRHPGGDVEGDLDVGGGGLSRQADGDVEENLVASGLDDERRQAGQVGEYGADEASSGVLSRRIAGDPELQEFPLSSGSTPRLVSMVVPARVRSAYGDMTKAAAGSGSPCSRAVTKVAIASPPPADSPAKAMSHGAVPSSRRAS